MHETHGRLVAIMFVQITEPVETDKEVPVVSILSIEDIEAICSHIRSFHGVIVDVRAGELFAHFPGAVLAFNAASSLLQMLRQHSLRIGLHLGEVPFRKGRFQGVDVNLASRLPGYVGTGGICVSQNVYQYLGQSDQQKLIALGTRELKNIQTVMPLYVSLPADKASHSRVREGAKWLFQTLRKQHRYLLIFCVAAASGFTTGSHHNDSFFSEQSAIHIYLPGFQQQEMNAQQRRNAGSIEMTIRSRLAGLDEVHLTSTRSNALFELQLILGHDPEKLTVSYVLSKLPQGLTIETGTLEAGEQQIFHLQDRLSDKIFSALSQHKIVYTPVASVPVKAKLDGR